jgi:hypothetical protein
MSIIATIAAQRQKLLDGIAANDGDINLRIFEDFYPDEAHFIYELLQNAEDAGATEVRFELLPDRCVCEHNGTRHFNERDIRGITGIFNSSKTESPDKIGKFGVGFKSVFVYTDTPIVYSRDHSFKILELVVPQEIAPKPGLGERTRFEFPFDSEKKTVELAHSEIKAGLEQLSETTLLFLNNLRYISWKIGTQEGAVLREEHSDVHVEILKLVDGKELLSSHWLRFSETVENSGQFAKAAEGIERQKIAVAFDLELLGDRQSFDKSVTLAKQFKVVPASKGTVSVFFPAEKETSGLRFHLHGPFIPELSRASIKNSPENLPLFSQLARLTAGSMHRIKDIGLLTGDFLGVLPNCIDSLPPRYDCIRDALLGEMREKPLVPTYGGMFAPACRLVQSRAALKSIFSPEDLSIATKRNDKPDWAIGINRVNNNQDRLLNSLGIPNFDVDDLQRFFEENARECEWEDCELNQTVLNWIGSKSFEWLQSIYSLLYKHCEDVEDYGKLSEVYFIRLTSGDIGTGGSAYFMSGPVNDSDPRQRVDGRILSAGTKKAAQDDAKLFLEKLGVREPNEADEIQLMLESRYAFSAVSVSDEEYVTDLKRMIAFSEKHSEYKNLFEGAWVFRARTTTKAWFTSAGIYLDEPYRRSYLRFLHEIAADKKFRRVALADWYTTCGIPLEQIARFAEWVGCQSDFDKLFVVANCVHNPNWNYLAKAPGARFGNGINRDVALSPEGLSLAKAGRLEASLLLWKALCKAENNRNVVLKACYQCTEKGGPHYSDSQLICTLKTLAWIPQDDGTFVMPCAALTSRLPTGFVVDAGYKWLEAVAFGADDKKRSGDTVARATRRAEFGIQSEDELLRAQAFLRLPEEEQRRVLLAAEAQSERVELPERPVRNADFRQKRVGEEAKNTPAKQAEVRERSVQLGVAEAKAAAKVYLSDQYTNGQGKMICQVCKDEMPFKVPNGSYYFEAVEILSESPKRYREGYLAMCPNHAAAYKYANAQRTQMQELIELAASNEIEVSVGGKATSIYFTQMHLADVQACLASELEAE